MAHHKLLRDKNYILMLPSIKLSLESTSVFFLYHKIHRFFHSHYSKKIIK